MIPFSRRYILEFLAMIGLIAALILPAAPSYANDTLDKVTEKSDSVLINEGWETRERDTFQGSLSCGLWAALISIPWRGWGHRCVDDNDSHYKLLVLEGISLGLIAGGLIIGSVTNDDKYASPIWKSLLHAGIALFGASYFFDLIGTFKGNTSQLAHNHLNPHGLGLDFNISWIPSSDFKVGAVIDFIYRNRRLWVNPSLGIEAEKPIAYNVGVDTGVAVWVAPEHDYTYLALAVSAKFDHYQKSRLQVIKTIPYIEFSWDLGSNFEHLEGLRYIQRIGFGAEFYNFQSLEARPFSDHYTLLLLESELNFNVFRYFNLAFIYRNRSDLAIGPIASSSRIFETVPTGGIGIWTLDFNFRVVESVFANVQMNFGTTAQFWLSVAKYF